MGEQATAGWNWAEENADRTLELPNGGGPMFFRRIEAGEFRMGSREISADEEPVHQVAITHPFYLGIFPVTQRQFRAWTTSAGIEHKNGFSGSDLLPAENMDWNEARDFCAWLKTHAGALPEQYDVTLPTEAQWEYACRAGTETEYCSGDGDSALRDFGWFDENSDGQTQPVGGLARNGWGVFDMHGNVWEWCLDGRDTRTYRSRYQGAEDPLVDFESSSPRAVRGGSWGDSVRICRSAYRDWRPPAFRHRNRGARVCLLPGPEIR